MKVLIKAFSRPIVFINSISLTAFLLFFSTLAFSNSMRTVYVYEKPSGSYIITSTKETDLKYRLIKTYQVPMLAVKARRANRSEAATEALNVKAKVKKGYCNKRNMKNRASRYKRSIHIYSRYYKVDSALVSAIIKNESCFRSQAKSRVGAIGLMQLMPGTARI